MADSDQENSKLDLLLKAAEASAVDLRRLRRYQFFTFLLVLMTAIYFTRDVLLPIVIAIILTLTLLPLIRFGEHYRIPTPVSAVAVILAMAGVFAGLGYVLSGPAQTLAADVPRIASEAQAKLGGLIDQVTSLREAANNVQAARRTGTDRCQRRWCRCNASGGGGGGSWSGLGRSGGGGLASAGGRSGRRLS
jgi:uncharacterized membrane protein YgcG